MAKGGRGAPTATNTNTFQHEPPISKKIVAGGGTGRGRKAAIGNTSAAKDATAQINGVNEQNGKLTNGNSTSANGPTKSNTQNPWLTSTTRQTLHNYRQTHRLSIPTSHINPRAAAVLNTGIGLQSPSMARPRSKRRTTKEALAQAVRKHFNALAVNETEAVTHTLYVARTKEKSLRLRFPATRPDMTRV